MQVLPWVYETFSSSLITQDVEIQNFSGRGYEFFHRHIFKSRGNKEERELGWIEGFH